MAQSFPREHHRIEVKLLQVFAWFPLILLRATSRKRHAPLIEPTDVRGKKSTGVGTAQIQPRKAIAGAFEYQMLQRNRGYERVTNTVVEERSPIVASRQR